MSSIKQQYEQIKEDQASSAVKVVAFLYKTFLGEKLIPVQINYSVISNTYLQIIEIIHIVSLYSLFSLTNNSLFINIQSVMSALIMLICLIPRISHKHIVLYIVAFLIVLVTISSAILTKLIIDNFFIFKFFCDTFVDYFNRNPTKIFKGKNLCNNINSLYLTMLIGQAVYLIFRFLYLFLIIRAYKVAKEKYEQSQKKKRRKNRYNEMLKKRNYFSFKRKT